MDLTSINGPIRPPRRRHEDESQGEPVPDDQPQDPTEDQADGDNLVSLETTHADTLARERIQVLGLHTCNPIVSYNNQVFSCSWADQIGTELVFAQPDSIPDDSITPLRQGPAYDLLAANSVKILGRKATVVSSSNPGLATIPGLASGLLDDSNSISTNPTALPSHAAAPSGMPRAAPATHQADFLRRLQQVKTEKGQEDQVRTVANINQRRSLITSERIRAWSRTEMQLAELIELNRRAQAGDEEAWNTLEHIIREIENTAEE